MNIERIQNQLAAYAYQRPERVIADSKRTETAEAITFDGEKRENKEKKESGLKPEQENTEPNKDSKGVPLPAGTAKTPSLLDIRV